MIKLEDINLTKFYYPVNRIIELLLTFKNTKPYNDNLDILYGLIDGNYIYLKELIKVQGFDFLEEFLEAFQFLMIPETYDHLITALVIWLKDHPEYLNIKEEGMILVNNKKGYDIHFETDEDNEPVLLTVSDGENEVIFSPDYCFQPITELIEDFERTIAYKNSL